MISSLSLIGYLLLAVLGQPVESQSAPPSATTSPMTTEAIPATEPATTNAVPMAVELAAPATEPAGIPVAATPEQDETPSEARWRVFTFERQDDNDFDRQPDGWSRRFGPGFPRYIPSEIDRTRGFQSRQSLRFDLLGGMAAYYSPLIRVDDQHTYEVRVRIHCEGLQHDAAQVSVSLLNHKRERVRRFLSGPVSGTQAEGEWVEVTVPRITPVDNSDLRFFVVGLHVINSRQMDVRGKVWFDDIVIARSPRMTVQTATGQSLIQSGRNVDLQLDVRGVDPQQTHTLDLELRDHLDTELRRDQLSLQMSSGTGSSMRPLSWELGKLPAGYYEVRACLRAGQSTVLEQTCAFAVVDPLAKDLMGEFGWSLDHGPGIVPIPRLEPLLTNAGVHWVKFPLWSTGDPRFEARAKEYGQLFEHLGRNGITTVGLLNDPPESVLKRFAYNLEGVSKLFSLPPDSWYQSIEPVIARYSFHIRHWQLGGESDNSFEGLTDLPVVLTGIKREFDRIGHDVHLGLHWDWDHGPPLGTKWPPVFLSWHGKGGMSAAQIRGRKLPENASKLPRWILLTPMPRNIADSNVRASDLALRMLAAKIEQLDQICLSDPFDPDTGVLHTDGSPSELFLPWRTMATTLNGKSFLGELQLEKGSHSCLLGRNEELVAVLWSENPATEQVWLGENNVEQVDLWGRRTPLQADPTTGACKLQLGPVPIILRNLDAPLMRLQLALRYERGKISSEYGTHQDALVGQNPFPQGINGKVQVHFPREWRIEPNVWNLQLAAGEKFRFPMDLRFPPLGTLGMVPTYVECELAASRPYKFTLYRPYQLGTGDVSITVVERFKPDGRLEIEQQITNNTDEILSFQCGLIMPGQRRQRYLATKIGKGTDHRFYNVWNGTASRGKEFRIRAEQVDGRRILNYAWTVGEKEASTTETEVPRAADAAVTAPDSTTGR